MRFLNHIQFLKSDLDPGSAQISKIIENRSKCRGEEMTWRKFYKIGECRTYLTSSGAGCIGAQIWRKLV